MMQDNDRRSPSVNWEAFLGLILVVSLYFMYSSTFLTDYLMNDELNYIGRHIDPFNNAIVRFFRLGRPLAGFMLPLIYDFVGYDPARAQLVRFISFASFAGIAVVLFLFLARRSKNPFFGLVVTLFFFAQLPIIGLMGYSLDMISFDLGPLWLNLLAVYVFFSDAAARRLSPRLRVAISVALLMIAMQFHQGFALFSAVPLTYLALTDWAKRRKEILIFLGISALALILATVIYKLAADYQIQQGQQVYRRGEHVLNAITGTPLVLALSAVNPLTYWTAFKLWSYPYPFNNTPPLGALTQTIATGVMIAWFLLALAAIAVEWRRSQAGQRWEVVFKWLTVLACFGFGGVFIVADTPGKIVDHRPHLALTATGVIILAAAYCLQVLASQLTFLSSRAARCVALAVVVYICFGAQSDLMRALVMNRASQQTFIRTELARQRSARRIFVILPKWNGCVTEPCNPWMGRAIVALPQLRVPGGYRYALAAIGEDPDKKRLQMVAPKAEPPADAAVIDWNKYVAQVRGTSAYLADK